MKGFLRRIILYALITLILCLVFSCFACNENKDEGVNVEADNLILRYEEKSEEQNNGEKLKCEVSFLDVGEGDCIFISLPDNKCALIDCGNKSNTLSKRIGEFIKDKSFGKIDYFILTHPDIDHVGNANYIIENFEIDTAYIPQIPFENTFPILNEIKENLLDRQVNVKHIEKYRSIAGEGYAFCFLSPDNKDDINGVYGNLDISNPSDSAINNTSAVIYFKCEGKSFLFTGDIGKKVESKILTEYKMELFHYAFNGEGIASDKRVVVDLENIDFLKVSHHGADDASSGEFLSFTSAKHAIFSVGGNNIYGHPNSDVLQRFDRVLPNCKLWRTDALGHISIRLYENDIYKIYSQK